MRDPSEMTREEWLEEIASLLAAGLLRSRGRRCRTPLGDGTEDRPAVVVSRLDLPGDESVHDTAG